jgi:hypothetical protein
MVEISQKRSPRRIVLAIRSLPLDIPSNRNAGDAHYVEDYQRFLRGSSCPVMATIEAWVRDY